MEMKKYIVIGVVVAVAVVAVVVALVVLFSNKTVETFTNPKNDYKYDFVKSWLGNINNRR